MCARFYSAQSGPARNKNACHTIQRHGSFVALTVYPKKYAHGFAVLCFVVVMQSFIMNSHEVFIHIHQGCFAGTGAIVRLPQCQWSKPDGYGKISQCTTTTKHSKAKTVWIFLGIYCTGLSNVSLLNQNFRQYPYRHATAFIPWLVLWFSSLLPNQCYKVTLDSGALNTS